MQIDQALDRPQGIRHLYHELWRYAAGARGLLLGAFALLVGSQLFKLAVPWLAGQAINQIQSGGLSGLPHAGLLLAGVFCATAASWAMHGPGRVLERNAAMRVRETLFAALTRRVLDAPLAWHEARHTAETVSRVNQATGALYGFAESQYIYLQNGVRLFGPVIALWLIAPAVGIVAVCGYMVLGFLISRFDRRIMTYSLRESQTERRLSAALVDSLGNIATVFALRRRNGVANMMLERMRATFPPLRRSMVINEAKWCTVDLLSALLWCVLVALYAWLAASGASGPDHQVLKLGNVFMVYEYAREAGDVITAIAVHYSGIVGTQASYAAAQPIEAAGIEKWADALDPTGWRQLRIEGLRFHHAAARGEAPALEGVDLALQRGRRYALVGPSGAGKSTLLRLLAGLDRPQAGTIGFDGELLADPAAALRLEATLIPQQSEIFEGTLRENLLLGASADDTQLDVALRLAAAEDFVAGLVQGLDTVVAERGANWSGGQRQRLALARAIVAAQGSSLLLLDEPTSSLDPDTERKVLDRVLASHAGACVVSSVHRLNLLDRFDEVVLMQDGRVLDAGPPGDLALRSQAFRDLLSAQTASPA
ncbi:MAG: ABC transporter ATP-binding protein [Sterolibacteriaceae bacterium]|nr:ABC transporter ATP-binding protein [Sterolibacteriaceae bacterium]MBK9085010.1 ABC transporter ATP-binding protein [Sterolibacteriaceae bacterium]